MFGSKAEVLERLSGAKGGFNIPPLVHFSSQDWCRDKAGQINLILNTFNDDGAFLAVRSSAQAEDAVDDSRAGAFESVLNVPPIATSITPAVETIIASMPGDPNDAVIVQKMAQNIIMSGVVLTRGLEDGAPYYVIDYDDQSGRTDTVTGGTVASKSVLIHADAGEWRLESSRLRKVLQTTRELEKIMGMMPLDIEFGLDREGVLHVFQVRSISRKGSWNAKVTDYVAQELTALEKFVETHNRPHASWDGNSTVFANMTDWNPAEMIGQVPRPLAASLYRHLITRSVWRESRGQIGYQPLPDGELMVQLANHSYIDVRASFTSLLPKGLSKGLRGKLVDLQLERLRKTPAYHDKVEFEVTPTVLTFTTREDVETWYGHALTDEEQRSLIDALKGMTVKLLDSTPTGSLAWAEGKVRDLNARQMARGSSDGKTGNQALIQAQSLLDEAIEDGTYPFAILARHGFIAEAFFRSAVLRGALSFSRMREFKRSIKTVAGELADDYHALWSGRLGKDEFILRYGHLRPSAYDILSPRYDQREHILAVSGELEPPTSQIKLFTPTEAELEALRSLFASEGMGEISAESWFDYAARAITGREYGKFVFTRNLSQALENLSQWGQSVGLDRQTLSFLPLETLLDVIHRDNTGEDIEHLKRQAHVTEQTWIKSRWLRLSYIVRDTNDLIVVPCQRSAGNFIGDQRREAPVISLSVLSQTEEDLEGRIVCIENADPGFDWVFTKGIAGLITRYGGANSHMAIRCAEFGLPAAIGCGELLYKRITKAKIVELNCPERKVRIIQ